MGCAVSVPYHRRSTCRHIADGILTAAPTGRATTGDHVARRGRRNGDLYTYLPSCRAFRGIHVLCDMATFLVTLRRVSFLLTEW